MQILNRYLRFLEDYQLTEYHYPALTDNDIQTFEKENEIVLPSLLRQIYAIFGGQKAEMLKECPYRLLPLIEIPSVQNNLLEHIEKTYGEDWENQKIKNFADEGVVENVVFHPARIPIFQNDNNDLYCLDYLPAENGKVGQIVAVLSDPEPNEEPVFFMFDNIEACLQDILDDLESDDPASLDDFFSDTQTQLEQFGEEFVQTGEEYIHDFNDMMGFYQEEVAAHLKKHFGRVDSEFSTTRKNEQQQALKLYYVSPDEEERPFHTFVTGGMSALPMKVPPNIDAETWKRFQRAEMMVYLPLDWELSDEALSDIEHSWPLQWLDIIANLPRYANTWLMAGKVLSIEEGDRIGNTKFAGFFIAPPIHLEASFSELITHHGEYIYFYTLVPLYPEEIAIEKEQGIDALLALMQKYEINALIDPARPNCAL